MAIDPVCRMRISEEAAEKTVYKDRTFFFCSKGEITREEYLEKRKDILGI